MNKLIGLLTIIFLVPVALQAQDLKDALRFSNIQVQGTARAGGMGNAFGALGGDFTSVSINPAGLGLYRSGELSFTPAFGQISTESSYMDRMMSDNIYNFSFNNLNYIAAIPTQNTSESGIVNVNIGLGFNRLKDFNGTSLAGTNSANGSFLDYVAANANAGNWSDFYEQPAWDTDLLLKEDNTGIYWHDLEDAGYGQAQRKSISTQGSVNEYSLGLGLNFNHKLYFGASLGIVDVYYDETSQLIETDQNNSIPYFNEFKFDSHLRTTGTGVNGKIGIIFKPVNEVRLGAAVHTPTFYNMHDFFETSMHSDLTYDDGPGNYDADSPYSDYDYDLESPLRATLSGAFVIAKAGLLSVDYEYVDYGSASLRRGGDGYDFVDENADIAEAYKAVGNIRVGGELRATGNISLRAGFEYYPSPYNAQAFGSSQPNSDANMNVYSAGFGYHDSNFFLDVAYRRSMSDNYDLLYPDPMSDNYSTPGMAKYSTVKDNVLLTLGFKF